MKNQITKRAATLAVLIAAAGAGLSGCEWDNSDDYYGIENAAPDDNSTPTTPDTDPDTDTDVEPDLPTLISGIAIANEPLSNALVCVDADDSGTCDESELSTQTDEAGRWAIPAETGVTLPRPSSLIAIATEDTTLAESGDPVTWGFYLSAQTPTFGEPTEDVTISTLTTLIDAERNKTPFTSQSQAAANTKSKLGALVSIERNYLSPGTVNSTDAGEYRRIARSAAVALELAQAIDSQIPAEDHDNLTESELNFLIFDQVNRALAALTEDTNETIVTVPDDNDFDPGTIIDDPQYDDFRQPPSTEPPNPTEVELKDRVANAENSSPYFTTSGFETFPVGNVRLLDFEFIPNPLREGRLFYEARERVIAGTDGDQGILDLNVAVPRKASSSETRTTFQVIPEFFCRTSEFDCQDLLTRPLTATALSWTGFRFATQTIQIGHKGRQNVLPLGETGNLVASSVANGFSTEIQLREFDLNGLDGRDTIRQLLNTTLPASVDWIFGSGTKAYAFNEELVSDVLLSQWPSGGAGNLCATPGMPDASITASCNLVYGANGQAMPAPAQTFESILYPVAQRNTTYNGTFENGRPQDAILLTGPTQERYVARLFGSSGDESGTIVIDRETGAGWETLSITGRWERTAMPFPRIELFLPGGFTYTEARIGFRLGRAYLFERQGYLRHGWSVPTETNLDTLFGRKQVSYVFNSQAFDEVIDAMESAGELVEHPFYSNLIDEAEAAEPSP